MLRLPRWAKDKEAVALSGRPAALARVGSELIEHLRMPLFRNGYALLVNGAATSVLGLLYWALAARLYPVALVGLNSALVAAMLLLAGIAQLSLNNVLVRYIPVAGLKTRRLILYCYVASGLAAVVVGAVFIGGIDFWSPALGFLNQSPVWQVLFGLAIVAWCVFSLQDSVLTGLRQSIWVPVENTIFAVVKIILLVVFAGWIARMGVFLSWTVPVALSLLPVNALIFGRLLSAKSPGPSVGLASAALDRRELLRYVGGNYLGTLSFLAYTNLLPLIVANLAGAEATAYFYLPWTVAGGLQLIATNLSISLTVEAAVNQRNLGRYCQHVLRQSLRLILPLVAVIVLGAPWFLRVFGSNYALQGSALLRWLSLATVPNAVVVLSLALARVQSRSVLVAGMQGAICVLSLGLSVMLLPRLGITGIGVAWFVSQLAVGLFAFSYVLRPTLLER